MEILSTKLLWEILKHARSWLANLDRASLSRKAQSVKAVRKVVTASRETAVYIRSMKDTGQPNHNTEARLAVLWTELGFELEDIGIHKLAKRCQIKGKHWADPHHYDAVFLQKADVSLESMEKLAHEILVHIHR